MLAPLSAANFFRPLTADVQRNSEWPDHLTIQTKPKPENEEFKSRLIKYKWRYVFHCNGKPVDANFLATRRIMDGYKLPGSEAVYTAGGEYVRRPFRYSGEITEDDHKKGDLTAKYFFARPFREGMTTIWFESAEVNMPDSHMSLARIKETNEDVIQIMKDLIPCEDGSPLFVILVPVDLLY